MSSDERELAVRVGVSRPENVRVLLVGELPQPDDPMLREAGREAGLFGSEGIGLTLGAAVFVRRGHRSRRTLSHELRHVAQYEERGGIAGFLPIYLCQVLEFGYAGAPFEVEARRHESD